MKNLLGVKIDKHLNWDDHIQFDCLINKLNSRICLLKRAKAYLSYSLRQLLYNALIRPLFEYCCTALGNTKNKNLLLLLRMQKRCTGLILDASVSDNSVQRSSKLGWIPFYNSTRLRKLCIMHKIINGKCLDDLEEHTSSVNDNHRYNTRASKNNLLFIPFCRVLHI